MSDGGPAFPNITPDMNVDGGPGMSLRDYFAAHALSGWLATASQVDELKPEKEAEMAYRLADAMLKEREK